MEGIAILSLLFSLVIIWIFSFVFMFRKKLSSMAGMMIAMTIGMALGLLFGAILAMVYPESFFKVTVISMLFGAMMGTIAGFPINMMAVLDGFLSGSMGGMMGTMLGAMISGDLAYNLINVIIVFSGGVLFLLFLMIQGEINTKLKGWKNFFFGVRLPLFILIMIVFYFSNQLTLPNKHEELDHSHSINKVVLKNQA